MTNNSQALYHLQKLNMELAALTADLAKVQNELADDTPRRRLEIAIRAQKGVLLKNENQQKKYTQEAEATSNKIKEDEQRLYQGKVNSPKELVELQTEVAHQKSRLAEIEELAFVCLTENESLTEELDKLTFEFQRFTADREVEITALHAQAANLKVELAKLEVDIEGVRSTLPAEILAHFDRLFLSKNKIAVALIDEDCCGVCGTELSKQVTISSRSASDPNTCQTCNRFLYNEH